MPDTEKVGQMFAGLAAERLPVPAAADVVARGRQRRRRARLTMAVSVAAAVALGLAGAGYARQLADNDARHIPPVSKHSIRIYHITVEPLPGPGSGSLLLGLTANGSLRFARLGHALSSLEPDPALSSGAGSMPHVATDPAGGWVVAAAAGPAQGGGLSASRLSVVTRSGTVQAFGPVFGPHSVITGLAVNPAGSMVAVAVWRTVAHYDAKHPQRGVRPGLIALVPLHGGGVRTWTLGSPTATQAQSLSWQDGGRLTYIPGSDATGGGFAGSGAVTLDVTAPGGTAPAASAWPTFTKAAGSCQLVAGAWIKARYLALEYCASAGNVLVYANPVTGQQLSGRVGLHGFGCPSPQLSPAPSGREVLVPSCGLQLYRPGRKIVQLGTSLSDAAFAG
jgi:hypothetical protein